MGFEKDSNFSHFSEQLKVIQESLIAEIVQKRNTYKNEKQRITKEIDTTISEVENQHKSLIAKVDHCKKQINKTKFKQRSLVEALLKAEAAGDQQEIKSLEKQIAELENKNITFQAIVSSYENNEVFEVAANRKEVMELTEQLKQVVFNKLELSVHIEDLNKLLKQIEEVKSILEKEIDYVPFIKGDKNVGYIKSLIKINEIPDHEYFKYTPYRARVNKEEAIEGIFNSWMRSDSDIKFADYALEELNRMEQMRIQTEKEEDERKYREKMERDERNDKAMEAMYKRQGVTLI